MPTLSLPADNLAKLQRVQSVAARIVAYQSKGPASSYLSNLHWLPIKHRINFKIATLTYEILATGQPGYLHTLLNTYQPVRYLRSQDSHLLAKFSVYISIGCRAFSQAAPQIWNAISLNIRNSPSFSKRKLTNIFTARCTLVQSAVLRSHVVCLSVRPSVRLWRWWIVIT